MEKPLFCLKNTVDLFLAAYPGAHPRLVLHTSCVLEEMQVLTDIIKDRRVLPILTRDSYYELLLLSRYGKLPRSRETADLLVRGDAHREFSLDLLDLTDGDVLQKALRPSVAAPVFFVFYTPAEAEEFAFGLKNAGKTGEAFRHAYLIFFDARLTDVPTGAGWMFTQPVPLGSFLQIKAAFENGKENPDRMPRVFRKIREMDGNADKKMDRDLFVKETTDKNRAYRLVPLDNREDYLKEFDEGELIRGDELIDMRLNGGEAAVLPWRSPRGKMYSVKMYFKPLRAQEAWERIKKLSFLAAYAPCFAGRAAFPKAAVYDASDGALCGFVMDFFTNGDNDPEVPDGEDFADLLEYVLTDILEEPEPGQPDAVWQILTPLTVMILEMRLLQINPADVSLRNILVSKDPQGIFHPFLIDCDSYETSVYSSRLFNNRFAHPELKESLRSKKWFQERRFTDFSFAVVLTCCITRRTHLLGLSVENTSWNEFDRTKVDTIPERQRAVVINQLTFKKDYPLGDWIAAFIKGFFSV